MLFEEMQKDAIERTVARLLGGMTIDYKHYHDGAITIETVGGDIVITTAEELRDVIYNWCNSVFYNKPVVTNRGETPEVVIIAPRDS